MAFCAVGGSLAEIISPTLHKFDDFSAANIGCGPGIDNWLTHYSPKTPEKNRFSKNFQKPSCNRRLFGYNEGCRELIPNII